MSSSVLHKSGFVAERITAVSSCAVEMRLMFPNHNVKILICVKIIQIIICDELYLYPQC